MRRSRHWNMNCITPLRRYSFIFREEPCLTFWGLVGHKSVNWSYFRN